MDFCEGTGKRHACAGSMISKIQCEYCSGLTGSVGNRFVSEACNGLLGKMGLYLPIITHCDSYSCHAKRN